MSQRRSGPCYAMTTVHADKGASTCPCARSTVPRFVFAATLAATVGSPGPAEAFFFLPILQQSQPSFESRSGRTPSDNSRWKGDRGGTMAAQPKSSTGTRETRRGRSRAPARRARAESRRQNPSPAPRRPRAPAAFVRSRRRARAAAAPTPRCAGKAPRAEAVRRRRAAGPAHRLQRDAAAQAPSSARAGSTLGDTFDEKLGEVFKVEDRRALPAELAVAQPAEAASSTAEAGRARGGPSLARTRQCARCARA